MYFCFSFLQAPLCRCGLIVSSPVQWFSTGWRFAEALLVVSSWIQKVQADDVERFALALADADLLLVLAAPRDWAPGAVGKGSLAALSGAERRALRATQRLTLGFLRRRLRAAGTSLRRDGGG